ncbi:tropomyosin alpha-1 chain-like [Hydractinia symbiolongicarpus]|uniref:tropomyosin alpha-1 chain-like n=1 Tax=Hydractinia symbiolongicarpus TaxID=13093 RepID=UPI002549C869|nr:tropomyosin alpha-1 chain-like [Hydractinia symbiolongicarpus]
MDQFRHKIKDLKESIYQKEKFIEKCKSKELIGKDRQAQCFFEITSLNKKCNDVRKKIKDATERVAAAEKSLLKTQAQTWITHKNNTKLEKICEKKQNQIESLSHQIATAKAEHMEKAALYENKRSRKLLLQGELNKNRLLAENREKAQRQLEERLHQQKVSLVAIRMDDLASSRDEETRCELETKIANTQSRIQSSKRKIASLEKKVVSKKNSICCVRNKSNEIEKEMSKVLQELHDI